MNAESLLCHIFYLSRNYDGDECSTPVKGIPSYVFTQAKESGDQEPLDWHNTTTIKYLLLMLVSTHSVKLHMNDILSTVWHQPKEFRNSKEMVQGTDKYFLYPTALHNLARTKVVDEVSICQKTRIHFHMI